MATVFLPHQALLLFSLCFRGYLPFHALLYCSVLLCSLTYIYSYFALEAYENKLNETNGTCDDDGLYPQLLLAVSALLVVTAAYRSERDRANIILLSYAGLGLVNWSLCAKNVTTSGWPFVLVMFFVSFVVKVDKYGKLDINASTTENTLARHYKKTTLKDINKVAMVLDGFIGPRGVVCGISRSYEAWIIELLAQGVNVVLFSAFPKEELEDYFKEKNTSSSKFSAYQVEAMDIKYVSQIYYATRCNMNNILSISRAFHLEKPDVVHVVFDGSSVPLFSWACALLRIPIVGIMHTDSIVICERNGFQFLAPLLLMCQKVCGAALESIATRSESFAKEMLRIRNWKCDHVIQPHVRTEVFKPQKNEKVFEIRKKLTFNNSSKKLTFNEETAAYSDGKFLMIYAGRFDIDKRVDELLEIMKILKDYSNVHLAMIGGGSLADDIKEVEGSTNRIFCHASFLSHEELSLYYNAADVHISASQMETLGNTVLESMACGTPVLVPEAQGFIDTVHHKESGLLWDKNIGIPSAVDWIKLLVTDETLLRSLKQGARSRIGHLSCESAVDDLKNWYVEAAENRRLKTLFIARLISSSFLLLSSFLFDLILFPQIKRGLESFSNKEVREKNRKEHLSN